jgi:prepilin-type N-terminal cleavage/methylation domain-containing protein
MVNLRSQRGFTFAEMIVVMTMVVVLALVAPRLFSQMVRFYQFHNAKIEVQRDARVSLDVVNRFLRQAVQNSVVIDQAAGQPPYSRITFQLPSTETIEFYQKGNQLFQVGLSTSVLSQNLQGLAFTYPRSNDPSIISVSLTMTKETFQNSSSALEVAVEKVRVMN